MGQHTTIDVRALQPTEWPALARLFGERGACGGCWCMFWRAPYGGARWEADKGEPNRRKFQRLVKRGEAQGCLAWCGESAVGWISVGPRDSFPYFARTRALALQPGDGVWSITCFFVPTAWRGHGVATALLDGAVQLARRGGATRLEAYPVNVKPGAKAPGAFAWTGVPSLFERAGFTPQPRSSARVIYELRFERKSRTRRSG